MLNSACLFNAFFDQSLVIESFCQSQMKYHYDMTYRFANFTSFHFREFTLTLFLLTSWYVQFHLIHLEVLYSICLISRLRYFHLCLINLRLLQVLSRRIYWFRIVFLDQICPFSYYFFIIIKLIINIARF